MDWNDVARNMSRSVDEVMSQYQWFLDQLYNKIQFGDEERKHLYFELINNKTGYKQLTEIQRVCELQKKHFPEYSSEVVKMELNCAMKLIKQVDEGKK